VALVDVRPSERVAAATAISALFFSTAGHTMLETARDALFLSKLPASTLPWMYLSIAGLGLAITRLIPARKTSSTASIAMLVACAFFAGMPEGSKAGLYALFIWTGTFGAVVNTELWLLLGGAFDVGQAKRLFGLVGAGAVLGATFGAFVARQVATSVGARHLLVAAAVAFALAFLPTVALERNVAKVQSNADDAADAHPRLAPLADPSQARRELLAGGVRAPGFLAELTATWKDAYLSRIGVFLILGTVTLAIGDYLFKAMMAERVAKQDLAASFATAYLAFNALSLVVQVGLTSTALRWLGVRRALLVLPALVVGAAGGLLALPMLWMAIALRSMDGALRHSLHKTTTELLFLPLPDNDRRRAKPVIDLVAQRGGQAVAAVGTLVFVQLGAGVRILSAAAIAIGLAWLTMAARVGGPYVDAFRKRLRRGALDIEERIPDLDLGALEAIFSALNSTKDAEVMGALDLLASLGRARLIPALLLYHPSRDVVLRALQLLGETDRDDYLPITQRLLDHDSAEVRAAALRIRAKVRKDRGELEAMAKDERPEMRATALVAIRAMGSGVGDDAVSTTLREMLAGPTPVALAVARAMQAEPAPAFLSDLARVAGSDAPAELRSEVALALGRLAATFPEVAEASMRALVPLLPLRQESAAARAAFETIGDRALEFLDALLDSDEGRGPVGWGAVRTLSAFEGRRAAEILTKHLVGSPDAIVRQRCIRYLARLREARPEIPVDVGALTEVTRSLLLDVLELLEARLTATREQQARPERRTAAGQLLLALFEDKQSVAMQSVFVLLGLLHPGEDFDRVARGLSSSDGRIRASSRELCAQVVGPPLRELLGHVIDDADEDTRLERALGKDRSKPASYDDLVRALTEKSGEMGALARYHARELDIEIGKKSFVREQGDSALVDRLGSVDGPIDLAGGALAAV